MGADSDPSQYGEGPLEDVQSTVMKTKSGWQAEVTVCAGDMCLKWEVVVDKKFLKLTKLKTPEQAIDHLFIYIVNVKGIDMDSVPWPDVLELDTFVPEELPDFVEYVKNSAKKKKK
eukprot:TRINITY_DN589_c0_g1_i2.p1 TRINITY_DN589_c0_g1~~TRINITY_DN589_c0_g1_i2.p1  ORF type:complete len:116 (-),score=27.33 TRINITY_DN589_c0_g1_i2:61-408(-)